MTGAAVRKILLSLEFQVKKFSISDPDEAVKNLSLSQPFEIQSAYSPDIPFTNFTPLFTATLDWIFYQSDKLRVDEVVPLPSELELKVHIAIPNIVNPSDHLALVASLGWL